MLKQRRVKSFLSVFLVVAVLLCVSGTAFAAAVSHYSYVALGDSLAAGQTPYGVENGYGYTNILQNDLARAGVAGGFHNFGKSGQTAWELLAQLDPDSSEYRPVLNKALERADIVTLDIGANDLLPHIRAMADGTENEYSVIAAANETVETVGEILSAIRARTDAPIYVMGYYDAMANILTDDQLHSSFLMLLNSFNSGMAGTCALVTDCTFVPTIDAVTKEYLPGPGDIHPNREGYEKIAEQFWEKIRSDFQLS